jgi:hypothetical protein
MFYQAFRVHNAFKHLHQIAAQADFSLFETLSVRRPGNMEFFLPRVDTRGYQCFTPTG